MAALDVLNSGSNILTGGAGLFFGGQSIFGGDSKIATEPFQAFKPPFSSVSTPGFNLSLGSTPSLTRTGFDPLAAERGLATSAEDLRNRLRTTLPASIASTREDIRGGLSRSALLRSDISSLGSEIGDIRRGLEPGFGKLSEERQKAIRDARDEAVGNLRESLSRRRVLGSSFANDAQSRTELAFGREAGLAAAETFQQEAQLQNQLAITEGNLLGMTAETLAQDANLFALDMGLNEQEANAFGQELEASKFMLDTLQTTIDRQLKELGITGDTATQMNAIIANALSASVNAEIESGRARGESIANIGASAATLSKGVSDLIGAVGGAGAGATVATAAGAGAAGTAGATAGAGTAAGTLAGAGAASLGAGTGGTAAALAGGAGQLTAPGALAPGIVATEALGTAGTTAGTGAGAGGLSQLAAGGGIAAVAAFSLFKGLFDFPSGKARNRAVEEARRAKILEPLIKKIQAQIPAGMTQEQFNASRQPPESPLQAELKILQTSDVGDKSHEAEIINNFFQNTTQGQALMQEFFAANSEWFNPDGSRTDFAGPFAPSLSEQRAVAEELFQ